MVRIKNKKADMSMETIITLIILAVLLVGIIVFIMDGWGIRSKFFQTSGGKINVDTVAQACQLACDTNQEYQYKSVKRDVIFEEKIKAVKATCVELESVLKGCVATVIATGSTTEGTIIADQTSETCGKIVWTQIPATETTSASSACTSDGKTPLTSLTEANCKGTWKSIQSTSTPVVKNPCDKFATA